MYKNLFGKNITARFQERKPRLLVMANTTLFYLGLIGVIIFLYDVGFVHNPWDKRFLSNFYELYAMLIFFILTIRLFLIDRLGIRKGWFLMEYLLMLLLILGMVFTLFSDQLYWGGTIFERFIKQNFFTSGVILYIFLVEVSKRALTLYHLRFNPTLLFVASFLVLIFLGTGLLLLPKATVGGISLLDALFTATSAVCVTGLIVVDTATYFTAFGKVIILILIQVGGLGIMTFTSFLALFFQRSSSFQSQLFMQNLVNEEKIGDTVRTVGKIVIFTFLAEVVGACFIFTSINRELFDSAKDRIGFSVFHAVSAFCNAGFSTLSDGLYDAGYRYNYGFQLIIITLIIVGGIGFPVIFNLYRYFEEVGRNRLRQVSQQESYVHTSRVINVNTKLVLITTTVLLVAGTLIYYFTELNSTLRDHTGFGKFVTALFGAVTPRTAGFNTVDMSQLTLPLILVYLLLMWIGASPGSTGGGIKTTTFALSIMNTFSIARGKDRVEAFSREIESKSVRQAFAVMLLSFLVIGLATLAITQFNPEMQLTKVAFEAFSAFSTVGLSLGVTADLTAGSKVVVIITMFLGRVGIFTLIASIMTKVNTKFYRYPSESIIIT